MKTVRKLTQMILKLFHKMNPKMKIHQIIVIHIKNQYQDHLVLNLGVQK